MTRAHRGFTLTELVVVLVLLGILAAAAVPRMAAIGGFRERLFLEDTLTALRHAKSLAVASGCEVAVEFSPGGLELRQRSACDSGAFSLDVVDPADNGSGFQRSTPSGVTLGSTLDPLVFDALGRATDGAGNAQDASVQVNTRTIAVAGETGFAHVP